MDDTGALPRREELGMELFSSPTSHYGQPYSGIQGYELKERVTPGEPSGLSERLGIVAACTTTVGYTTKAA